MFVLDIFYNCNADRNAGCKCSYTLVYNGIMIVHKCMQPAYDHKVRLMCHSISRASVTSFLSVKNKPNFML